MITERYLIERDDATKVLSRFYLEDKNVEGLEFDSRQNGDSNSIAYKIKGFKKAKCKLTMSSLYPSLIKYVEISGNDADKEGIRKTIENLLKIELSNSLPTE